MEKVLTELTCPPELIAKIMGCVKTNKSNIIWNGQKLEDFVTSRGLRQGDPILPYIFMLGMKKVTHIILYQVRERN